MCRISRCLEALGRSRPRRRSVVCSWQGHGRLDGKSGGEHVDGGSAGGASELKPTFGGGAGGELEHGESSVLIDVKRGEDYDDDDDDEEEEEEEEDGGGGGGEDDEDDDDDGHSGGGGATAEQRRAEAKKAAERRAARLRAKADELLEQADAFLRQVDELRRKKERQQQQQQQQQQRAAGQGQSPFLTPSRERSLPSSPMLADAAEGAGVEDSAVDPMDRSASDLLLGAFSPPVSPTATRPSGGGARVTGERRSRDDSIALSDLEEGEESPVRSLGGGGGGEDGEDGEDGKDGEDGEDGEDDEDGEDGEDGGRGDNSGRDDDDSGDDNKSKASSPAKHSDGDCSVGDASGGDGGGGGVGGVGGVGGGAAAAVRPGSPPPSSPRRRPAPLTPQRILDVAPPTPAVLAPKGMKEVVRGECTRS